jgi:hypothetical protein
MKFKRRLAAAVDKKRNSILTDRKIIKWLISVNYKLFINNLELYRSKRSIRMRKLKIYKDLYRKGGKGRE